MINVGQQVAGLARIDHRGLSETFVLFVLEKEEEMLSTQTTVPCLLEPTHKLHIPLPAIRQHTLQYSNRLWLWQIDFWGARPHKHPRSSLKSPETIGRGTQSSRQPPLDQHSARDGFKITKPLRNKKKKKRLPQMNSQNSGYVIGCFKRDNAGRTFKISEDSRAADNYFFVQSCFKCFFSAGCIKAEQKARFKQSIFLGWNKMLENIKRNWFDPWHGSTKVECGAAAWPSWWLLTS